MKEKPLIETNPFLRNKKLRDFLFATTTSSNAAVEGVHIDFPAGCTPPPFTSKPKKKRS